MFLHLSVSHSVHSGACTVGAGYACLGACVPRGMCGKGGFVWQNGVCMAKGDECGKGGMRREGGACVAGEAATAVDGMHPTGMHSCLGNKIKVNVCIRTKHF